MLSGVDDRRAALEGLRDKLAASMDALSDGDPLLPQFAGQFRQVLRELDELPVADGRSARERFAERVAAANAAPPSA